MLQGQIKHGICGIGMKGYSCSQSPRGVVGKALFCTVPRGPRLMGLHSLVGFQFGERAEGPGEASMPCAHWPELVAGSRRTAGQLGGSAPSGGTNVSPPHPRARLALSWLVDRPLLGTRQLWKEALARRNPSQELL